MQVALKMQSTALSLCRPSTPPRRTRRRIIGHDATAAAYNSFTNQELSSLLHCKCSSSISCFSFSSRFNQTISSSSSSSGGGEGGGGREDGFKVNKASASVSGSSSNSSDDNSRNIKSVELAGMFGAWYLLNIYFNIYNKQVLKVYPFPATVTAFQFGCGTVIILLMWTLNLHPKPNITPSQVAAILPLAVAHTIGNVLTNISLGRVAVSFTHTIKAMEPFFTVLLASLFIGEKPTIWVVSSLLPIVGGVALASFTESSFNWIGFATAMASNLTNQSRNVLSKKLMVKKEESLDNINIFSVLTIISFIFLVPTAIFMEGLKFTPSYLHSAASQGLNLNELYVRSLLAGFCFHSYQQVSYYILGLVSPITHSVGNCLKRVVVIVSSVIFFRIPVSPLNSLGTAIALLGVFLYSLAKRMKPKVKSA